MPDNNKYSQQDIDRTKEFTYAARSLTEELKEQLGIKSRLNETERATLNLSRQLQKSAEENTVKIENC